MPRSGYFPPGEHSCTIGRFFEPVCPQVTPSGIPSVARAPACPAPSPAGRGHSASQGEVEGFGWIPFLATHDGQRADGPGSGDGRNRLWPGCCKADNEEMPSEQGASVELPQSRTPKPDSTQEAQPSVAHDPPWKDILLLDEHNRTHTQEIHSREAELYQSPKQVEENLSRRDSWRLSALKYHRVYMAKSSSHVRMVGGDYQPLQTSSSSRSPIVDRSQTEKLRAGNPCSLCGHSDHACRKCGKSCRCQYSLIEHQKVHT